MFYNPLDNRSLYNWYDFTMRSLQPYSDYYQNLAKRFRRIADTLDLPINIPFASDWQEKIYHDWQQVLIKFNRKLTGRFFVAHMLTNIYIKPQFNITEIKLGDEYCDIVEIIVKRESFCNLIHFKKMNINEKLFPKLLIVAPMSGHYATLLRNTVRDLLPFYDVYITDWKNARDVPLIDGSFDLDDFIEYIIAFIQLLGPDLNVMAVCQPTVPVLAALALMSSKNHEKLPHTAILLGGPIDTSQSPTKVNALATSKGDGWFEQNVISMVPARFPGAMRLVYPGFMQLSGFLSMNLQRHIESLNKAIDDYANNHQESAFKTILFYLEYFSTMDLTAEFYMQTINTVFQQQLLVKGRFKSKGNDVSLKNIKKTAILAIEGEKDDITGIGQTKSVITLCKNLPDTMKKYVMAKGVGHYGLFNGSKFRNTIIPEINAFISDHQSVSHKKMSKEAV